ncbi:MAG: hypothetical protein F6K09_01095 [Merismopedia sp. SIO2A8]|nr:hypothetical protein [Symploca sp. SIO2B6]NET47324.1 hypothetical protein [Merismopedia sp. SIO2A8]
MNNHDFLANLNDRRADSNAQLATTIDDLLRQVEDLRQQLKQSQDAAQRESGAEGIAKEAAKAVVRATKMLAATYGSEGVELFREHLNEVINNPNNYDGDWTPSESQLPELPQSEDTEDVWDTAPAPTPTNNNGKVSAEVVEVAAEVVNEDKPSGNGHQLNFSGFKNVQHLKRFAADYIDPRRKTRKQIEWELHQALKEQGVTQSEVERYLQRGLLPARR